MRKFLTVTALLSLFATASAQTINPTDTKGTGADADQVERGTTTASVTQTVNLKLPEATALHQHYAARAGLPVTPPVPARQPAPAPTAEPQVSEWPTWQTVPDDPALQPPGARQELRTPNGYRVALEGSTLEVMRKGYLGSAPTLALPFGPLPAGTWRMRVRIDLLRNFTTEPHPYALGIGHDGHLQTTFTAHTGPGDLPTERDVLPAQQWILLTGTSPGGQFEITVRAMDVALSISELTWNGQSLLYPPPALLA